MEWRLKVEYLSNLLLDHTQILDLGDQSKVLRYFKWRRPHNNLKIFKVEYISKNLWIMTCEFLGKMRGQLRGNLECGSAQPSLFLFSLSSFSSLHLLFSQKGVIVGRYVIRYQRKFSVKKDWYCGNLKLSIWKFLIPKKPVYWRIWTFLMSSLCNARKCKRNQLNPINLPRNKRPKCGQIFQFWSNVQMSKYFSMFWTSFLDKVVRLNWFLLH
jgi:hypothetical protein